MTDIRPTDLPELRSDIYQWINGPDARELWSGACEQGAFSWWFGEKLGRDQAFMRDLECTRLAEAELFYVSADMARLAQAASATVPGFALQPEDLPSPSGLLLFEEPPCAMPHAWAQCGVKAVCWGPAHARGGGVFGSLYLDRSEAAPVIAQRTKWRNPWSEPRLIYGFGAEFAWEFGKNEGAVPPGGSFLEALAPVLRATWLLMQQPLARAAEVVPNRASQKRLRRAGQEPKPVRVIELRRPVGGGSGDGQREYHHQWIVRGHWRQQWYPGRQVHRPVWIAPHIKGPEGAPMIGCEKVYAWKR